MLDDDIPSQTTSAAETAEAPVRRTRRRAASRPAGPPQHVDPAAQADDGAAPDKPVAKKSTKKTAAKKSAAKKTAAKTTGTKNTTTKKAAATESGQAADASGAAPVDAPASPTADDKSSQSPTASPFSPLFQPPSPAASPPKKSSSKGEGETSGDAGDRPSEAAKAEKARSADDGSDDDSGGGSRRRRSRGGRNRRKSSGDGDGSESGSAASADKATQAKQDKTNKADKTDKQGKQKDGEKPSDGAPIDTDDSGSSTGSSSSRRRRRRRRDDSGESSEPTAAKSRESKPKKESITSVEGSTRIEAKKQRRREGREAGRRRPPILSESEFLARRESVERVMAIRQRGETTQIAVLEDNVLVEHYVALDSQSSIIGNVYLGRVQNVLPSMEAAFIDIGKGRNAVLYAGEVNWDLVGDKNKPRRIENALKPGQAILVQVSKDPIGHKGARLTSQISLPGRYLVYVPGGETSGISRKLPDTERNRLKNLLKEILPDDAGVIIRTAAEGASEEELTRDVNRLTARWEDIDKKSSKGQAPQLLYAEPDTTLKVVRDLFTEDFAKLVISGDDAWDMVDGYVQHVAPDLADRLERHDEDGDKDLFANYRIDEQISKALDRKVWLPSGGSLVIDRTEAMTVIDVNTGKFTGSGGNLEETVTKNNLEAAEEIVRQLRLRDIGGIIVVDFIDMVLESNRDLVLRRLVECLGRDRTRHQVAEVTSLGLVQMTRKRISTGLLEAFSHSCEQCQGRGVIIEAEPIDPKKSDDHGGGSTGGGSSKGGSKRSSNRRRGGKSSDNGAQDEAAKDADKGAGDKTAGGKGDGGKGGDSEAQDGGAENGQAPADQSKVEAASN